MTYLLQMTYLPPPFFCLFPFLFVQYFHSWFGTCFSFSVSHGSRLLSDALYVCAWAGSIFSPAVIYLTTACMQREACLSNSYMALFFSLYISLADISPSLVCVCEWQSAFKSLPHFDGFGVFCFLSMATRRNKIYLTVNVWHNKHEIMKKIWNCKIWKTTECSSRKQNSWSRC